MNCIRIDIRRQMADHHTIDIQAVQMAVSKKILHSRVYNIYVYCIAYTYK